MQPAIVTSSSDLVIQNTGSQQPHNIYRPVATQLIRQQLPTSSNSSISLPNKPQQQQIVIRQGVPFSATQQVANSSNTSQQNAVALSSPLLVNLLQSDVHQSSNSHQQQQHQFVTQPGAQQIRLITPPGTHTDGTQVMMMVRVSSAPQGGTTQLINPATGSIVATVPSSQVTSIASPVIEQQQQQVNTNQVNDPSSASITKPKKPRKSRSKKSQQADNGKNDSSGQTSMALTTVQVTSSSGTIASIPLSMTSSNQSR